MTNLFWTIQERKWGLNQNLTFDPAPLYFSKIN